MTGAVAAPRAKPLNARTRAALPAGLRCWADQIDYLREALQDNGRSGYTLAPKLRDQFAAQLADLERARVWLESKLAAEGGVE